jgi:transposase-like protein
MEPRTTVSRVTYTQISKVTGVSTNQVWTWAQRRHANGFPEPVGHKPWGKRTVPVFDLNVVLAWWFEYEPDRGGRPPSEVLSAGEQRRAERRRHQRLVAEGATNRMTITEIARAMGVPPQTAYNWVARAGTNGFPEPVESLPTVSRVGALPLYDLAEVTRWRATYRPMSGGSKGYEVPPDQRERRRRHLACGHGEQ